MPVPPISSMTMSMSGARTTSQALPWRIALPSTSLRAFFRSLSATRAMRIARPARRRISSALRLRTSQVPPPTVPMPSRPALIGLKPPP
jgi:hypothetical protein